MLCRYAEVEFFRIGAQGIPRSPSLGAARALLRNSLALVEALRVIQRFRPRLLIGTGGYVSFAPLWCGTLLGIPTMIHEQNVIPGLVNRLLAPRVERVLLTYAETARHMRAKRIAVTGLPLRPSILTAREMIDRDGARRRLKLDPSRPTVLVMGGSSGAQSLHDHILRGRERLSRLRVQLVILAGRDSSRLLTQLKGSEVRVLEHTSEIGLWLRAADLVVCRAGGTTLAEVTALGVPAIVVPWPGATAGHQELNARWMAEQKACRMLKEDQLSLLVDEVIVLLQDGGERLRELAARSSSIGRPEALDHVIREVEPYLRHEEELSLHRHRRGWHERLGLGAPSRRLKRQRLGS